MIKLIGRALTALAILLCAPDFALAQATVSNTLPRDIWLPGGINKQQTAPMAIVVLDSVSGLPCIVGLTATCVLPGTGGGGSLSATASATPTVVTAGTGKALNVGLFSNLFSTLVDGSGNVLDLNAPGGVKGLDGSAITSASNPLPQVPAPSANSSVGIAPVATSTASACQVIKASAGNFYSASGYVSAAATFVMVFDAASAPADGTVTPKFWVYAPVAGTWSLSMPGGIPAAMASGVTICASSTGPFTKTAFATNNAIVGLAK